MGWPSRFLARVVRPRSRPVPVPDPVAVTQLRTLASRGQPGCPENTSILPRYLGADPGETEVPLLGGDMTEGVVRVGRTVRRPVRPHTPAVHALLRHLEAVGFDGAPRVLGIDGRNREVLTYLPGFTGKCSLPDCTVADSTLAHLAELLLRYHQAVIGFKPPPGAQWDGELTRFVDGPADIICHCDVNLENVIFRTGPDGARPYAFIDFDLARPGTRLVDVIQTLRYWAPIADPADRDPAFLRRPRASSHRPFLRGVRTLLRRPVPSGASGQPVAEAVAGDVSPSGPVCVVGPGRACRRLG